MTFSAAAEFDKEVQHLARLAMRPGWWAYARARADATEKHPDTACLFAGLRAAVGAALKVAGFKPALDELVEMWIEKNQGVMQ